MYHNGKQIWETIDRLKTGNLIISDFKQLKAGMTPDKVKLVLGKETRIAQYPYEIEYVLEGGTTVELTFKGENDTQTLDNVYLLDTEGNKTSLPLETNDVTP
jgi:hypothetical protein